MILRKIIKIVATRCQILRLKCTKFDFGWCSVQDPAGGTYRAPPDPLAGFKGPTSKGREGRERKGGGGRKEKGGEGEKGWEGKFRRTGGREGKGVGPTPFPSLPPVLLNFPYPVGKKGGEGKFRGARPPNVFSYNRACQ